MDYTEEVFNFIQALTGSDNDDIKNALDLLENNEFNKNNEYGINSTGAILANLYEDHLQGFNIDLDDHMSLTEIVLDKFTDEAYYEVSHLINYEICFMVDDITILTDESKQKIEDFVHKKRQKNSSYVLENDLSKSTLFILSCSMDKSLLFYEF